MKISKHILFDLRLKLVLINLCLFLFYSISFCYAQITFEGCRDSFGYPVASVADRNTPDIAVAIAFINAPPIIRYNPDIMPWLSRQFRLWIYAHGCAHHALGHLIMGLFPPHAEQQADCWGIVTLVRMGLFSPRDVAIVQSELSQLRQGDWAHLPGPMRAINLSRCLGW